MVKGVVGYETDQKTSFLIHFTAVRASFSQSTDNLPIQRNFVRYALLLLNLGLQHVFKEYIRELYQTKASSMSVSQAFYRKPQLSLKQISKIDLRL